MKNNIILLLIIFIALYRNNCAQEITPEQKQKYIQVLSDSTSDFQFYALLSVIDNNIVEARETIQQNFWRYSRFHQTLALKALYKLDSGFTLEYANRLIDTLNNNPDDFNLNGIGQAPDILSEKVAIANIMFSLNDFSQVSCIFELIDRDGIQEVSDIVIDPLIKIMQNVSSNSEQAKNKLIYLVYSSNDLFTRSNALIALEKSIGIESLPIILQSFQSDSSDVNRYYILNEFLSKYSEDIDLSGILRERIYTEQAGSLRLRIAKILLYGPGGISNYNFVKNYINDESDEIIKDAITFEVEENIPRLFYEDSTLAVILDSLISVTNQVHIISWLGDLTFSNELKNILTTAKTNLQNGDSLSCRVQVKTFQDLVDNVYKDSLNTDQRFVTIEGWKFLYWNAQYILDRLPEPPANPNLLVNLKNSLGNQLPASNVKYYEGSWKDAVNNGDGTFTVITTRATISIRVFYEYASQQVDNVPAQNNTYTFTTVNAAVQLKNSLGNLIDAGTVQYYSGAWRTFGTTSNGVAYKELLPINYSFRMTYEYGSIDKQQNISVDPTVVFQTVNAAVQLKNSLGNLIDQGTVQYYAGAWRTFGTTSNGVAYKELLPINYSFRMTYEYGSIDKQQNLSSDPTVIFQTANAAVQLKNSLGNLIDAGTVQYYAGAWRTFGTTSSGVANKELLPINYSFRMTYEYGSIDKQQNLSSDPTVVFQTVNSTVKLLNSQSALMPAPMGDQGTVQYYAGAWRSFGTTSNGVANKELLPINYSFRMTYEYGSIDKQQNLSADPTVIFQTVNAAVQLKNSLGNLIDLGTVKYYAGAWRSFGTTSNGVAYKELLPINYSFRMTYEFVSKDKQQNLSTNPVVDFNTVLCSVKVSKTSDNQPINNADVKYYAGAWRNLGTTNTNGIATKELLPANISFRATSGSVSLDKQQDISVNNLVEILLNVP